MDASRIPMGWGPRSIAFRCQTKMVRLMCCMFDIKNYLTSGNLKYIAMERSAILTGKHHHVFLWPISIAMLDYQRVMNVNGVY